MVQTPTLMKTTILLIALLISGLCGINAQDAVVGPDTPPTVSDTPAEETAADTAPTEATVEEEEVVIPSAFDIARYESTWEKNPFLLKTTAPTQPTVTWTQDWALAGMFNHKGKIRISIRNKQTSEYKHISNEDKPDAEFRLVKANFNRNRNEASAVIAKGTEEAELKYDDSTASQPVTINNTMKPAGAQGQINNGTGVPGAVNGGGIIKTGQPPLNRPGVPTPNGRVFNAPNLPGGIAGQQGAAQQNMSGAVNNGSVVQPGIISGNAPGINVGIPNGANNGTSPPVISRRRQLIPAPVIPAQP